MQKWEQNTLSTAYTEFLIPSLMKHNITRIVSEEKKDAKYQFFLHSTVALLLNAISYKNAISHKSFLFHSNWKQEVHIVLPMYSVSLLPSVIELVANSNLNWAKDSEFLICNR